jgi:hypothetical protein
MLTDADKFFVRQAGGIDGEFIPYESRRNRVTPIIDGENYFREIRNEVNARIVARNGFFYFAGWTISLIDLADATIKFGEAPQNGEDQRPTYKGDKAFNADAFSLER